MSELALSILAVLLAIYNYIVLKSNNKLKNKLKEKDDEAMQEKLKAISEERDRARERMRNLLEHYRGDGPSGDA